MQTRFRSGCLLAGGLVAAALWLGCTGRYESAFPVVVVNRAANTLQVLANGSEIGQVTSGQSASFSLHLAETSPNILVNGVAPTPQADVIFSAKDMRTGAVSQTKTVTLSQNPPTYVTFSASDFPNVAPTVARFTNSPPTPGVNQDVFFNATSSTATNATYTWDFGDGTSGSGVTVTHRYSQTGAVTVVLNVVSDNGQTSTQSRSITISAGLPPTAANFTFSPTTPGLNQAVVFSASPIAGATFAWDFGDNSSGTGATTTHAYAREGTFGVTLRVSNDSGQSATMSRTLAVSATLPAGSVTFTFSPTTPGVGDDVFFNASGSTVTTGTFAWDFGDGTGGSGQTPTHRYSRVSTYTVTLRVTNTTGQSGTTTRSVPVSASSSAIAADFTFSPTDPTISRSTNTVLFDATPSNGVLTTWTWDFGDGSAEGSGQKTSHVYTKAGTWVVRLTIVDTAGRTATTSKNVTVNP